MFRGTPCMFIPNSIFQNQFDALKKYINLFCLCLRREKMSEKEKKKLPDSDLEKHLGFEVNKYRRRHYRKRHYRRRHYISS